MYMSDIDVNWAGSNISTNVLTQHYGRNVLLETAGLTAVILNAVDATVVYE